MTRTAKMDATYGPHAKFLAGIRRVEAAWLAALSVVLVAEYGIMGSLFSAPLIYAALALLPRQRDTVASTRAEQRRELLNRLLEEALGLRGAYMSARGLPLAPRRSQALQEARREIILWIESSKTRLKRYPEFAGILEARGSPGGVLDDLDGRTARLAEIRRLDEMSRRLGLPI